MNPELDKSSNDPEMPPSLLGDLQAIYRTPVVPAAVDASIRNRARVYFASQRRIRLWVRWAGSAAAVLVLGAGLWLALLRDNAKPMASANHGAGADALRPASPPLLEDIDHNGRVDVLDAFAVARGLKARQTQPAWDVDHNGVVDQRDVDQIANRAVRVKGGRP
jgi:hypothetical protein